MFNTVRAIAFDRPEIAIPAFTTLVLIPLTFSITQGILWGFVLHALMHLVTGRTRELKWAEAALAVVSVLLLVLEHSR
jgi:AGZA family xanthine/uracil permease-like MFS transporter